MLMMDRVTEISDEGGENGKGHVVAEFDIKPDLWFFECHFEGDPSFFLPIVNILHIIKYTQLLNVIRTFYFRSTK